MEWPNEELRKAIESLNGLNEKAVAQWLKNFLLGQIPSELLAPSNHETQGDYLLYLLENCQIPDGMETKIADGAFFLTKETACKVLVEARFADLAAQLFSILEDLQTSNPQEEMKCLGELEKNPSYKKLSTRWGSLLLWIKRVRYVRRRQIAVAH